MGGVSGPYLCGGELVSPELAAGVRAEGSFAGGCTLCMWGQSWGLQHTRANSRKVNVTVASAPDSKAGPRHVPFLQPGALCHPHPQSQPEKDVCSRSPETLPRAPGPLGPSGCSSLLVMSPYFCLELPFQGLMLDCS